MTGILKVNTVQDADGNNIINENANTVTVGKAGDTVNSAGNLTSTTGTITTLGTTTLNATSINLNGTPFSPATLPTVTSMVETSGGTSTIIPSTPTGCTVTGTGFATGATVQMISTTGAIFNATSSTFVSATSITCSIDLAEGAYYCRVENTSGYAARSAATEITASNDPTWTTSAGSLGTFAGGATGTITTIVASSTDSPATLTMTEVSGTGLTGAGPTNANCQLTYATVGANTTGTIASSGGFALGQASTTTYSFTIRATDATPQSTDRIFTLSTAPNYMSATGGTISYDGDYKIHTFTSNLNFIVTELGIDVTYGDQVEYLIVGSGGGGGTSHAGGGGAGGYRHNSAYNQAVTVQTYTVVVGDTVGIGTSGNASSVFGLSSAGGGKGGTTGAVNGDAGGSGGGGAGYATAGTGGAGNTPVTSPVQGYAGGLGNRTSPAYGGGGGGGASGVGVAGTPTAGGTGGAASSNDIHGSALFYSGGGGGHTHGAASGGAGGSGVGGDAEVITTGGRNIAGNYGAGGGGGQAVNGTIPGQPTSGNSSAGVVIIRYKYQ